jgi:glyoxylate reductase
VAYKSKLKILLTRTLQDFAVRELKRHYNVEIHEGPFPIPKTQLIKKIKDKDGLICYPYDTVDREVIGAAKNLKTISTFSVGYDHIDTKYAKKRKIIVGYTPEVLAIATADLTLILILDILRRVTEGDRLVRAGKWKQVFGADTYVGEEIPGKTLGIIGLGRIGRIVARRAQVFGINVIYHNRTRLAKKEESKLKVKWASLDSLLKKSDIVSILVPYTKKTHELINIKMLKKMKRTAFLVNTARGKIIKESDLVLALKRKIIAGAALDVYYNEPIGKKHPLTKFQNVILSPHIGSSSVITRAKMSELTVKNLKRGLEGKKPVYSV